MHSVSARCEFIKKNIVESIDTDPKSAALALGKLLNLEPTALREIFTSLSHDHLKKLWMAIEITELMDEATRSANLGLKHLMLQLPVCFNPLDSKDLIEKACGLESYRFTLIALIRKANWPSDVFESFNFSLLNQVGPEQDIALQALIQQCKLIPIDEIKQLANTSETAQLILLDLASHHKIFEIGEAFAIAHPSLRSVIATHWQAYFDQYPLSATQTNFLRNALPRLRLYTEFENLNINSRLPRVYERAQITTSALGSLGTYVRELFGRIVELSDSSATERCEVLAETRTLLVRAVKAAPAVTSDDYSHEKRPGSNPKGFSR